MSLPIAGKPRPSHPATHATLDLDRLMKLGVAVEDAAEDTDSELVTPVLIDQLAEDLGERCANLYAAAAMTTDLEFDRQHPVTFVFCAGGCQGWGALDNMELLLDLRRDRAEAGLPVFNVLAKNCLDRCQHAPAVMMTSPDGTALLTEVTREKLIEAVEGACD
ncbi:MAG TPA: hypothetical protein VML75_20145 [Kofleriaceae bacterium]|nr:hypothetical protein [Kofleriaceae bacterium]